MSTLARVYLAVTLSLLVAGGIFSWLGLRDPANESLVDLLYLLPSLDAAEPVVQVRRSVPVWVLATGWVICGAMVSVVLIRLPFRIRRAAMTQRRLREYRAEVLELRTLPLRQAEEDAALAEEAHLDAPRPKVMTEKLRREELSGTWDRAEHSRRG